MSYAIAQIGEVSPNSGVNSPNDGDVIGSLLMAHIAFTYRHMKGGLKLLAKHAQCSPNTAKTWYDGKGYPHGVRAARVCAHSMVLQKRIQDACEEIRKEGGYDRRIDAFYEV